MKLIKKIASFFVWIMFTLIIVLVAVYLIIIANGYKINFKTWRIAKTGMINLISNPSEVNIYVNNQLKSTKTPYREIYLWPGRYDIKITKENYHDWQKTLVVQEGLISSQENIQLFLSNPRPQKTTELDQSSFDQLVREWQPKGLEIKNGDEIFFNDILVTRFYQPIQALNWYADLKHIIVQLDREIHIIDSDGSNNIKLVELSQTDASQFIPYDNGTSLLYRDSSEIKKIKIQ